MKEGSMYRSRRQFLTELTALGASALIPSGLGASQTPSATPVKSGWIDLHHHHSAPGWDAMLATKDLVPSVFKGWTPAKNVEAMDKAGVAVAVTSAATYPAHRTELGMRGGPTKDNDAMRRIARELNEVGAKMMSDYPGRFGLFAVLPLPYDIDGSLREIEYSFDTLKADGVLLGTSYDDKWLGDPTFTPILEELNKRKAVVDTHPVSPTCCVDLIPRVGTTTVEFGTDTTRTIVSLLNSGALTRFPDLRFIFSHAGGTMPFLIERIIGKADLAKQLEGHAEPNSKLYQIRQHYYDSAQAGNPASMTALKKVVPLSQIVFGTDFPYSTIVSDVSDLKGCGVFSAAECQTIGRENALKLVPRFRT
jgi:predicted TIM-barrel fold metal-dependent hydrolase